MKTSHEGMIKKGWTLIKIVGTPVGLIGICERGYRSFCQNGYQSVMVNVSVEQFDMIKQLVTNPEVVEYYETLRSKNND